MKITIPRIFDSARLLATQAGKDIEELVSFSQTAFEQLIRVLRNNVTFEDNVKCSVVTVTLLHGRSEQLYSTSKVIGIIPTKVNGESLTSHYWEYNDKSQLMFTARFLGQDTKKTFNVTLILLQE